MTAGDEAAILRARIAALEAALSPDAGQAAGAASMVVQTTTIAAYPTVAASFFAVVQCDATGSEVEGGPGTITPNKGKFVALNIGTAIPPLGTNLVITRPGGRWIFRYDG